MVLLADVLDNANRAIGRAIAWLALVMVLVQFGVVLARYVFGVGNLWAQESIVYMHALLFMLGAAYTLSEDGHVRVDIIYRSASPRYKAWVNLLGSVFLLIPVSILIIASSWSYVSNSWRILERSMEASGIPGVFALKTAIPVFGILMAAQGLVLVLRSLVTLLRRPVAELVGSLVVLVTGAATLWFSVRAGLDAAGRLLGRLIGAAPVAESRGEAIAAIVADTSLVLFPLAGGLLVIAALAYGTTAISRLEEGAGRG